MKKPVELFKEWMEAAIAKLGEEHATSVCLASSNEDGKPSARMVLLKDYDEKGFVFYTNFNSRKGKELLANPNAAMCFYWQALGRQVRIEGVVEQVTDAEADKYFNSRHPRSRVGAIVSKQSEILPDYEAFIKEVERLEGAFQGNEIPRPENWSGFRIKPTYIEFWQEGKNRLHHRLVFKKNGAEWDILNLYP